jgi:hypothetical protein
MLRRSSPSGTIIAEIVDSRAVDDALDPARACDRLELRVQLVFAEETTIGIVSALTRVLQFFGLDYFVLKAKLLNDLINLRALILRQARGLSGDADCASSELFVGDVSDIAAIDAA